MRPRSAFLLAALLALLAAAATGQTRRTTPAPASDPAIGTSRDRDHDATKPQDDEEEDTRRPRPSYYPPRPNLEQDIPELSSLLDEIEVEDGLPLFGQRVFRQAIIARYLRDKEAERPTVTPPPSYQILPGDEVAITFWNAFVAPTTATVRVRADGTLGFDPVGVVRVVGMTRLDFEEFITEQVRLKGPRDATVRVVFTDLHAVRVSVSGEVRRYSPGVVLAGYATLFDALAAAGGPTSIASLRNIMVHRAGETISVDFYEFLLEGKPSANFSLRDGDVIHVPVARELVTVIGQVNREARYELGADRSLRGVLEAAGGFRGKAARIQLTRVEQFDQQVIIDLPIQQVMAGTADLSQAEPLRNGDQVKALEAGAPQQFVNIKGAIGQPGDYGFTPGLTLAGLVGLAQGIPPTGHAPVGVIRRVRPDGQVESINFRIAELRQGGASAEIALQPGDAVLIPEESLQPRTVVALGAFNKWGTYLSEDAMSVSDLIRLAGGLAPRAALDQARLISTRTGQVVETAIDLTALPDGGEPVPNQLLANGDILEVPFLAQVGRTLSARVEGYVRNPGTVTLTEGMRVADLLRLAGGLLPRAASRGKLVRVIPGTRETDVVFLDLQQALAGSEEHNLALREDDVLRVDTAAALLTTTEPRVVISGPVKNPGAFTRYRGMTVSDLIREAGGMMPEADAQMAWLVRLTAGGRPQRIRIEPGRAAAGDAAADLELLDGDVVEMQPILALRTEVPKVLINGAVYTPGSRELTIGMTVDDLLYLAGGPIPNAYLPRAELYRRLPDGRRRVIAIDLAQRPLNLPLQDADELRVYTQETASYREPTVEIKGDVQRPGLYERTEEMTLRDLLFVAGGPTRNSDFMVCEVARSRGYQTISIRPQLDQALAGDETQDLQLQDGDTVFVRTVGDYTHRAPEVLVRGKIMYPGFYPLAGERETVRHLLLERAGGLLDGAFTTGAVLLRRVDQIIHPEVARYASDIYDSIRVKRRRDDVALVLTRSGPGALEDFPQADRVLPISTMPGSRMTDFLASEDLHQADQQVELLQLSRGTLDATARQLDNQVLSNYVRVSVDLGSLLNGEQDLELRPNDILLIPDTPELVLVQGEVNSNMALTFVERQTVAFYIGQAGGYSRDADVEQLLIVRANGNLSHARANTIVARGDLILVPPKRLKLPREERPFEYIQAVSSILGGFATTIIAISQAFR